MGKPTFTSRQLRSPPLSRGTGVTVGGVEEVCWAEYIGSNKRTRGTETSQYLEERTSTETPSVVASERGSGQRSCEIKPNGIERPAIVGVSPVGVMQACDSSRAGHVKPCLNMGGPPSKPKYSSMTDSEQVP